MKNIILYTMLNSTLLLSSCSSFKQGRVDLNKKEKIQIIQVLEKNELLFDAFFDYNGKEIESRSQALISQIENIKSNKFNDELEHAKEKLKLLSKTAEKEENNKNYNLANLQMIKIVNKYDIGPDYNVYTCSMLNKRWIQNSKNKKGVMNPYADYMPHCGAQDTQY